MKPILDTVAGFLVQQTWQIPIVVGLVLVACWMLRNASAHWRYLLWLVVITKCLMPPMVSLLLPVLPVEEHTVPLISPINVAASNGRAEFDSSVAEIAHSSKPIPQQAQSAPLQSVAGSPAARESSPLPTESFNLREWLVTAWLMFVGLSIIHITGRMWLTSRRLRHTSQPADDEIQSGVGVLAKALGMTKTPAVHMCDSFAQPFVWGWLRGDIYLPLSFSNMGTVDQRRAILTHELAHVLRWDAAVNHLQNFVQALFFFHPLVWWTNQKIRQEREKCCDEIVLSTSGMQPRVYCEAIVGMLAQEYTSHHSTPALAVTGSIKNVKERITTMLSPNRKFRRRPSRAAVITLLLVAACVLPTAVVVTPQMSNAGAQDESTTPDTIASSLDAKLASNSTWARGQTMDFRVINANTSEPIPDVALELQNMGPGIDFQDVKIQKTDIDGWSRIPLPDLPPTAVRVYPVKEGFVPLRVYWEAAPHPTMPKSITIPMEPGKKFGGIVRNETGEPISDVKVTIDFWGDGRGENPHIRANIKTTTKTDKSGRWQVDVMPAEIDNEKSLRIYLNHPGYVSDHLHRGYSPTPATERPPLDELFDQSAVMVMHVGETIEGTVVDRNGKPIPNAEIYDNRAYWFDSPVKPRATTGENGSFRITGVKFNSHDLDFRARPGREARGIILAVQAASYAPELIFVNPKSSPLNVQLDPGESVRGQVVDENGQPLEGVIVDASQWRGQTQRVHLEAKTDAEGIFRLHGVPADEITYGIYKEGYMHIGDFPMVPSSDEYKVILKAPVRIVGLVTDAETGKPLEKFSLVPGGDYEDGRNPYWHRFNSKTIVNQGQYAMTLNQEQYSWRIRVEADGYMPSESRIFRLYDPDTGEIKFDFKLAKAAPLTGTVLGLDNNPLAGADVYLETERMNIEQRKVLYAERPPVKTDASGRFQFPPEVEPFCLVVVHEQGIAMITEAECRQSPRIAIEPWTTKREQLQIIRKPATGQSSDFPVKWP